MTEGRKCLSKGCKHKRTSPFCDDCWTKRIDETIRITKAEQKAKVMEIIDERAKLFNETVIEESKDALSDIDFIDRCKAKLTELLTIKRRIEAI